jgi:tRNA-Thr(GGU) m(6)t(6)A37 methyltransferase TsaA
VPDPIPFEVRPVGHVASVLADAATAPRQPDEGAPDAWLVFASDMAPALADLEPGHEILILTWLDRADRDILVVHPRGDATRRAEGVFSTRSPHRPNPIGLHRARIIGRDGVRLHVEKLEALDGTPILDIKPVLGDVGDR